MAKIIAIANQKGGVGKTTTTINLGGCLGVLEYKTLIVDADPQANATSGTGFNPCAVKNIYDCLVQGYHPKDVIVKTESPNLDILPAHIDLVGAELEMIHLPNREYLLKEALETNGLGTGAAVADIDGDGVLELLISHGESGAQPLSLYKAKVLEDSSYLRIKAINYFGAPARGATVTLNTNMRNHSKTIDAGSGYLCQMEPVAHYGIRKNEVIESITIKWTNGNENKYTIKDLNKVYEFKQPI